MSEAALTEGANEHVRAAERYAAELIDKMLDGHAPSYDRITTVVAVAYLEGQCSQLKWARDKVRGDA